MDSYTEPLDTLYWRVRVFLGQGVVTCFLFYSGYGIATAIKKRGDDYVRAMPRRRILPTLFVYDCSQIIFLMVQLSLGKSYSAKDYVLSFLSIKSFGNDNWYIFVILGLYLITWLVLRGRELNKVTAARVSVCALAFLLFMRCSFTGRYWYDTVLCYPLGIWYCLYQDKINSFMAKGSRFWPTAIVIVAAFFLFHELWQISLFYYVITMLLFALCIVLFTMKFKVNSPILRYCGRHLQGLFLLHRVPFILLSSYFPKSGSGIYAYFALSIVITFLLEAVFSKAMAFLKNSTPVKA